FLVARLDARWHGVDADDLAVQRGRQQPAGMAHELDEALRAARLELQVDRRRSPTRHVRRVRLQVAVVQDERAPLKEFGGGDRAVALAVPEAELRVVLDRK